MEKIYHSFKENLFLFLGLFLATALSLVLYRNYLPDDVFIHLRFTQNLVGGKGWSFNPNQPTYGTTSPLWILFLSFTSLFSKNLLLNAKILGMIFMWGSLFMFNFFSRLILNERKFVYLATLVFALDPWFIRWSVSGMEVSLTIFLILSGLYLHLSNPTKGYRFIVPLLFGLATLCRPECGMLIILLLMDELLASGLTLKAIKAMARDVLIFLLVYGPWLFYAKKTFGTIIPNTALAKALAKPIFSEFLVISQQIAEVVFVGYFIETLLILYAAIFLFLNSKGDRGEITAVLKRYFLVYSWILAPPIFYLVQTVYTGGRYMLIVTFLLVILSFKAIEFISPKVNLFNGLRKAFSYIIFFFLLQQILLNFSLYTKAKDGGIISIREVYIYIGKWFASNTPEGATVAIEDIGAVGFFSNRQIIDLAGLVTPDILKYRDKLEYLKQRKPDYYVGSETRPMETLNNRRWNKYLTPVFTRYHMGYGPGKPRGFYVTVYKCNFNL